MIKILLVEDDVNKRAAMAEVILNISSVTQDILDISTDAADARRKLTSKGYDLLLLDINLPKQADKLPEPAGGLEVLRWLKTRGKNHRPPYIVGTTAHDQSLELAQSEFNNLIWTIVAFSYADNSWREKLATTVGLILDQVAPPYTNDGSTYRTDVLVITALNSPELDAVRALPIEWQPSKARFDDAQYYSAKFDVGEDKRTIVCVAASDKGLSSAAIGATKAILAFRPQYLIMVGICAGIRGRTDIGDVIVADPSWDWGSGKTKLDADGEEFLHPAQYQMRLDETLRTKVVEIKESDQFLWELAKGFPGRKPSNTPRVHIGAFASGAAVLQSKAAMDRILEHHKDLIAVDMEVYSVMLASHLASNPRPKCIAAKAVSDFGDDTKSDNFQTYAAAASAAFLMQLLQRLN